MNALARRIGIDDQVVVSGPIDEEALIQLYSVATVLLQPSLCEGFGNPIAEAMACGCPVITSSRSAMPEVTAGAALLVDPLDIGSIASALRKIWEDHDLAAQLSEAGLARARELSWADFARANIEIYRSLL